MITLTIIAFILFLLSIRVWYREYKSKKNYPEYILLLSFYYIGICVAILLYLLFDLIIKYLP